MKCTPHGNENCPNARCREDAAEAMASEAWLNAMSKRVKYNFPVCRTLADNGPCTAPDCPAHPGSKKPQAREASLAAQGFEPVSEADRARGDFAGVATYLLSGSWPVKRVSKAELMDLYPDWTPLGACSCDTCKEQQVKDALAMVSLNGLPGSKAYEAVALEAARALMQEPPAPPAPVKLAELPPELAKSSNELWASWWAYQDAEGDL